MFNPSNNFSSDLDPYDRLAQMLDGGLFGLLPLPPSWAKYVRAQYTPDPSLFSAPATATPGFDKSPMFTGVGTTPPGFRPLPTAPTGDTPGSDKSPAVPEALAAADPGPAGFHRSPAFLGAGLRPSSFALSDFEPGGVPPPPSSEITDPPGQQWAAAQPCGPGYDACMAAGSPRIDCIRLFDKCKKGIPTIFAPGFWGKQT